MQALANAGGWKDRTTVEDMDLAVRASLKGWKFVFIGDLSVSIAFAQTLFLNLSYFLFQSLYLAGEK